MLGVSANGKARGLPATYAYWTGAFNGTSFVPDADQPQWLDRGFDFYGAVTYPHHDADGNEDPGPTSGTTHTTPPHSSPTATTATT